MTEPDAAKPPQRWATRLAADPTLRFFALGALLFLAHRLMTGDPRVIKVTPGVRADVERRVRDHAKERPPTPDELSAALEQWKREEALYREALREGLDRDDPAIRTLLADKVRARAALSVRQREPSDAELEAWLRANGERYAVPRRYDYETVVFPRSEDGAERHRDEFERELEQGKEPRSLGRPIVGGKLPLDVLRERVGEELSERLIALTPGRWERYDDDQRLMLVRLKGVEGGAPASIAELRPRLAADLLSAERERVVEQAVRAVVDRYRFEDE